MNDLRELTDAELDIVGGGAKPIMRPEPTQNCERRNKAGRGDHCRYSQAFGTPAGSETKGVVVEARPSVSLLAGGGRP
jgi:hypothetical protein